MVSVPSVGLISSWLMGVLFERGGQAAGVEDLDDVLDFLLGHRAAADHAAIG